jgi:hypothetical protein
MSIGSASGRLSLTVQQEELIMTVVQEDQHKKKVLWLDIMFRDIMKMYQSSSSRGLAGSVDIFVELRCPPRLYDSRGVRLTDYPYRHGETTLLGASPVCCLTMVPHAADALWKALKDLHCVARARGKQKRTQARRDGAPKLGLPPSLSIIVQHLYDVDDCPGPLDATGIDEDLIYALSCLLSAGYVHATNVDERFLNALREASNSPGQSKHAEAALFHMWHERRRHYDVYEAFSRTRNELSKAARSMSDHPLSACFFEI